MTASRMRVLEVVTVPFFTPRGTAFSALDRTRALSRLGHAVEVLAYPLGDGVDLPGVRVHRVPGLPGVRSIPMGPSAVKLWFDLLLAARTAWWLLVRGPWDLVLVHEEAAFWTAALHALPGRRSRGRLLYDRHSSLAGQLANFGYSDSGPLRRIFGALERFALRRADGVIVISGELEREVRAVAPQVPVELIENLPVGWDLPPPDEAEVAALRARWGLEDARTILYTGSFGRNQGLETAIDAMPAVVEREPRARLVLVGGAGADLERVRAYAAPRGLGRTVLVPGPEPAERMPAAMALADVLLSPRTAGTTPLKVYAYLGAGRPIVATAHPAHAEVLTGETAELVAPTAAGLAAGVVRVLADPERAGAMAAAARRLAGERYGPERYMSRLTSILERCGAAEAAG